ncbi:MAG: amidohydrolase family protein [Calditrichia bacterium]
MKLWLRISLLLLILQIVAAAQPAYTIYNVSIVNVETGTIYERKNLTIAGSRITGISDVIVNLSGQPHVIDASDKFLIPGLWDMHTHTINYFVYDQFLQLMLANGVVGFRDTWGNLELAATIRSEIQNRQRPPMLFQVAGNLVDGRPPIWPGSNVAADSATAVAMVDSLADAGAEFIKTYSRLNKSTFFAIAKRAKERGIRFAGHIPNLVKPIEASEAGIYSVEHLTGMLEACSMYEDSLLALQAKANGFWAKWDVASARKTMDEMSRLAIKGFSEEKAQALFKVLKENKTWQVPTLVTNRAYAYMNDSTLTNDPRRQYLNKGVTQNWDVENNNFIASRTPEAWESAQQQFQMELKIIKMMYEAGVPILAGTDPPNPWCFPGFSLHDELELMVSAGLPPLAALQTATLNPAMFMDATDSLGTVRIGNRADLILLNANPLENISNTRSIEAVISGGILLQRDSLDTVLGKIYELNGKKSIYDAMAKILRTGTFEEALEFYSAVQAKESSSYDLRESELNRLGYFLLSSERAEEAITILRINSDNYPESANCFDSLGDAYLAAGRTEEALASYQKVLALDPTGEFGRLAREAIAEIEQQQQNEQE